MFADYNYVNHVAPATAQILITIIEKLGIEIDKEIGTCICAGIITDTGGFQYANVTAETFEFAALLLSKGINVSDLYKKVFSTSTRANFELTKLAMDRTEFIEDGKLAFTYITSEDEEKVKAETGDHEAIVNFGRNVEGVEVSVFLRETEKGYKASLRSNEYVNVSDVCVLLGGGGHIRAAGCTLDMPLEQAKEKVLGVVKKYLK